MSLRTILARRRAGSILALAVFSTFTASTFAADVIKADVADNLELGSSWGGTAPTVADVALFNSTLATNGAWTLGAAQSWGGIRVANPGVGPLTINGTVALTIGAFGVDMSAATQDLTINTPVTISGAAGIYNWNVAAGRTLTVAALPTKLGHTANHLGLVKFSTTGTIKLGPAAASTVLTNNQNNPYALYGDNDWAARDATGTVVAATYNAGSILAGANNDVTADIAGPTAIDMASLRFNDPVARTVNISTSATSRTSTLRGILMTANSGGGTIANTGAGLTNNNGFIRPARATVANTAFPIIQNSTLGDLTISAVIGNISSGTGTAGTQVVKYGVGKVILTAPNGHPSGTFIQEGTIEVGGTLGTLGGGQVVNNASLILNRTAGTLTLGQVISGNGSIEFKGAGIYQLTGANTYTAANNINGGLVEANSAAALGTSNTLHFNGGGYRYNAAYTPDLSTYTHTIGASGATIDTNGSSATFAGNFGSGSTGGLTKIGAGTLTLNGASNYGGTTTINAGRANLNGGFAGGASVATGATLGGTGTLGGTISVASGGIIAPGNSIGTLTASGLTLDAGAQLDFEFASIASFDRVVTTSSNGLTINGGGFNLFNNGTTDPYAVAGNYDVLQFAGSVQGTGVSALSVLNPAPGKGYAFSVVGNNVRLAITNLGVAAQWAVDANGSWNTAANWTGGVPNASGDTASFTNATTAARTVTLDGNKTIGGATFNNANGFTIAQGTSGTLTLGGGTSNALIFVQGGSHSITAPVSLASTTEIDVSNAAASLALNGTVGGAGGLTTSGVGTVSLGNASNSYAGATSVEGGTLAVAAIGSLGSNAALNLSGGGVIKYATGMTNDLSTAKTVTLGAGGGGIDTNGNDVSFATSIAGTGGLMKAGAGKLTLTTANAYTGATNIRGGTLSISTNDQLGAPGTGAAVVLNGGTLEATASFGLTDGASNRTLTVGSAGGTVSVTGAETLTLSGITEGAGQLTKSGSGTLTVNTVSARTGVTRMEAGTLTQVVNGALGSGQIDLVGGNVALGGTTAPTLNVIGSGSVSGGSGGGLTDVRNVTGSGTLVINVTTGVLDLDGDMSAFTGTLDIQNAGSGGIRLFGGVGSFGSNVTVNLGAGVQVGRRGTVAAHNIGALTGTGNLNAISATTGPTTYNIGGKNIDATFDGVVGDSLDGTTAAFIAQTIINKVGTGKQVFNGQNYYTGLTTINAGTLQLGPAAHEPVLGGPVMSSLLLTPGGANILGGKLVFDYTAIASPGAAIDALLTTGYNGGVTPFATGQIKATVLTAGLLLGSYDNTTLSTVTVAQTLPGDANVDFAVTFDDLLLLAQNYGSTGVWGKGDFNYSGNVDFDDLLALAQNYGSSLLSGTTTFGQGDLSQFGGQFQSDWAAARALVPEPMSLSVLAFAGLAMRRRRD